MILTVDVGNTNIKIGAWDKDNLAFVSRIETKSFATSDEYSIKILDLLKLYSFNSSQFDGAIMSSVVPQITNSLSIAIQRIITGSQGNNSFTRSKNWSKYKNRRSRYSWL